MAECYRPDQTGIMIGATAIREGKLVAFPTETVYGLGADALNAEAVKAIFRLKGRPADNPLIVHVPQTEAAKPLCVWNEAAEQMAKRFWPGPLTLVLPKASVIPDVVSAGLNTVALRCPRHPVALELLKACDLPVAAPSANRSGRPSPTLAKHVMEDFAHNSELIVLDGGPCEIGLESSVLDLSGPIPALLRPGAVTAEEVIRELGACKLPESLLRPLQEGEIALSPGMKHRHYAPKARLTLVSGPPKDVSARIRALALSEQGSLILCLSDRKEEYRGLNCRSLGKNAQEAAQNLFALLRQLDEDGISRAFAEAFPEDGLGLALMNRLLRAAAFDKIDLPIN